MASYIPNVTDIFPEPSMYRPDFSFMDTMLRRRQAMYDRGYQELAGKYKFISRDVTNPNNLKTRDEFVNQAMVNLKDLSAMDLSQQQNVDAAGSVFEPFVKNTDVLGDMALTAHWNQQESIAENLRLKDGGKEFSQDNLDYVRKQRQAFSSDNPSTWKNYYANRRSYTPYYDWNKEFKEWFKEYKPNSLSLMRRAGLYNITEEDKGATAQDLKMFFSSVASEKAKSQMKIEASVRMGDSPEQLAPYYKAAVQSDISSLSKEVESLTNQYRLEKNQGNRKQLEEELRKRTDKIDELNNDIKKIDGGDLAYLKANGEKIAFSLYFDQAVTKLANGLSWKDYKREITGDQVAMMKWKDAQEWARERYKQDREDRRKEMETKDEFTMVSPPGNFKNMNTMGGLDGLAQQTAANNQANAQLQQMITNHVATVLGKDPKTVTARDLADFQNSRTGKMDPVYLDYKRQLTGIMTQQDMLERQKLAAEDYAKKKLGSDYNKIKGQLEAFKKQGSVNGISAAEMLDAVIKGTAKMEQQKDEVGRPITGLYTLTINGKQMNATKSLFGDDKIVNMYEDAVDLTQSVGPKRYRESMDQYFGEAKVFGDKAFIPNTTGKTFKKLSGTLSGVLGVDPSTIQGLMLGGRNDAYFMIANEKFNKDPETAKQEVLDRLTSIGLDVAYDDKVKSFYIRQKPGVSNINLGLDLYSNYTNDERQLISFGQQQAGSGYVSPHFYPGNIVQDKNGRAIPQFYYKVMQSGTEKMYYLYNEALPDQALKVSTSLTDVMDFARSNSEKISALLPALNN